MVVGQRLQLDPSLDVNTLNLTPASKLAAIAMQKYGLIFTKTNGKGYNSIYAERLEDKADPWGDTFGGPLDIPLDRLRVIAPLEPPFEEVEPEPEPEPEPIPPPIPEPSPITKTIKIKIPEQEIIIEIET